MFVFAISLAASHVALEDFALPNSGFQKAREAVKSEFLLVAHASVCDLRTFGCWKSPWLNHLS